MIPKRINVNISEVPHRFFFSVACIHQVWMVFARIGNGLCFCYQNLNLHSVCNEFYIHFLSLTAMCFEYSCDCNEFYTHFLSHTAPKDETHVCVHTYISVDIKSCSFWYLNWKKNIELLNNNSHGLLPPGGLVSPSGGFVSLLCDQGLHFASIKLCQASWMWLDSCR